MSGLTETAFALIATERERQDSKWGVQTFAAPVWLAILTEEVGELAEAIVEMNCRGADPKFVREELTHVAAVATQWLEALEDGRA